MQVFMSSVASKLNPTDIEQSFHGLPVYKTDIEQINQYRIAMLFGTPLLHCDFNLSPRIVHDLDYCKNTNATLALWY